MTETLNENVTPDPINEDPQPSTKKSKKKLWIGLGAGLAAIVVIAAISDNPSKSDTNAESAPTPTPTRTVIDSDKDGVPNSEDGEPYDATWTASTHRPEVDTDADGVPDSRDGEPNDATWTKATPRPVPPNPADYAAVSDRNWALIAKDPAAHAGEKIVIYAQVTQFDAATGTSGFRGQAAGSKQEYWFSDGTNTIFIGDAALLAPIVEDDVVKIHATVVGDYSYDTQVGGSTTVPQLKVDLISVV